MSEAPKLHALLFPGQRNLKSRPSPLRNASSYEIRAAEQSNAPGVRAREKGITVIPLKPLTHTKSSV